MNIESVTTLIDALIGMILLGLIWTFGWRRWAIDAYRQDLFALRDRLFDLADSAEDPHFTFSSPAYGRLRFQFNGAIRLAHRVSMVQLFLFVVMKMLVGPRGSLGSLPSREEQFGKLLVNVTPKVRSEITAISAESDSRLLRFLFATSPLFWFGFTAVFSVAVVRAIFRHFGIDRAYSKVAKVFGKMLWDEVASAEEIAAISEGLDPTSDGGYFLTA